MSNRTGIFAGDDPFEIARTWLEAARDSEATDPNAMAISTVDQDGMPNVRMVLLKDIAPDSFVFYTNYDSQKAQEIESAGKAAFVLHWKSLARQLRVRGTVVREDGPEADAYYASRPLQSRLGAWASQQSRVLMSRDELTQRVAEVTREKGTDPARPAFWGGYRIVPTEIEFWADGAFRLHDRFQWRRQSVDDAWTVQRLSP